MWQHRKTGFFLVGKDPKISAKSSLQSGYCNYLNLRNFAEIDGHIPDLQELPVRVNLPNSTGDLVMFLGIIAVVHHSCNVAGFQGGKLCVDFHNGILRQNPPWGRDSLFFRNGFFQPFQSVKRRKLLCPPGWVAWVLLVALC